MTRKPAIIRRKPAFIDHERRGPPIEAILDAVEEVRENRRCRARPDQPFGFESLDFGIAQMFALGVEQSSPGPQLSRANGLLQRVQMQQHRQAGDATL